MALSILRLKRRKRNARLRCGRRGGRRFWRKLSRLGEICRPTSFEVESPSCVCVRSEYIVNNTVVLLGTDLGLRILYLHSDAGRPCPSRKRSEPNRVFGGHGTAVRAWGRRRPQVLDATPIGVSREVRLNVQAASWDKASPDKIASDQLTRECCIRKTCTQRSCVALA